MVPSVSTLGVTFYSLGMGLLGGFAGNILAGWYHDIGDKPTKKHKVIWMGIYTLFGVALIITGIMFM